MTDAANDNFKRDLRTNVAVRRGITKLGREKVKMKLLIGWDVKF